MKNTVLKFGLYAAVTTSILFTSALVLGKNLDFSTQEVLGYASIIASLLFVFFGIKHYRDRENNGTVSFAKALLVGILISLFASLAFGIIDVIYVKYINPEFTEQYMAYTLENMEKTMPPEEFRIKKAEVESQMAVYANPAIAGFVMFITVLLIGFIISLLSAFILKRNQIKHVTP